MSKVNKQNHFFWLTAALVGMLLAGAFTTEFPESFAFSILEFSSIGLLLLSLIGLREDRPWRIRLLILIGIMALATVTRDVTDFQYSKYLADRPCRSQYHHWLDCLVSDPGVHLGHPVYVSHSIVPGGHQGGGAGKLDSFPVHHDLFQFRYANDPWLRGYESCYHSSRSPGDPGSGDGNVLLCHRSSQPDRCSQE